MQSVLSFDEVTKSPCPSQVVLSDNALNTNGCWPILANRPAMGYAVKLRLNLNFTAYVENDSRFQFGGGCARDGGF